MYRNCIFCSAPLGTNEVIESLPAGSQIAFDAWKGRLWLVCPRCARWNLAPMEERWEPVEQAEKLFTDAPLRVQHENIGVARLPDGTRLIRVGAALPGELAAWRYGRQLLHRRNKYLIAAAAGGAALAAVVASPVASIAGLTLWTIGGGLLNSQLMKVMPRAVVYRLPAGAADEKDVIIRPWHIEGISVISNAGAMEVLVRDAHLDVPRMFDRDALANYGHLMWRWGVRRSSTDVVRLRDDDAHALLRRAMVHVNGMGAGQNTLAGATQLLAESGSSDAFLRNAAASEFALGARAGTEAHLRLKQASLAFEMALNEETERRALDGDLRELNAAWREAEEIAAIADSLPLPSGKAE